MKTINLILRIGLVFMAVATMVAYWFNTDEIELLIFSFSCGIFARLEAIYDKLNEN